MAKNKSNHLGSLFNRNRLYDDISQENDCLDYHFEGDYNSLCSGMTDDDFRVRKIHHRKYKRKDVKENKDSNV